MGYLAFYNKYRPQTFDEVVGQEVIVKTLKNAIKEDKIAHAYLFCGPRGTGKTTMARLFAKALNCEKAIGEQCLECFSCKSIANGNHPDVYEIDAASNSTVDSVRELIDNVSYQPISGRYKVYIIDEVHNMSNSAFNALLKTLEEPPAFVIFILATTEPQKILPTILSRVQRYDFSKVLKTDLVKNMKRVLDSERIKYDVSAIEEIATISDGGVRDSLSLLDQVVSYSDSKITLENVNVLFGLTSKVEKLKLIQNIAMKNSDEVICSLREKYQRGVDMLRFHLDILNILKDMYIYSVTGDEKLLERVEKEDILEIKLSNLSLKYMIKVLTEGYREYKYTDDVLSNCELTFLSLLVDEEKENRDSSYENKKITVNKDEEKKDNSSINKYVTKPTLIEPKKENILDKKECISSINSNNVIKISIEEILNLMQRSNKLDRVDVEKSWGKMQDEKSDDYKKIAKSLSLMNVRLVDKQDMIILASSQFEDEVEKLTKKELQSKLKKISKKILGEEYNILTISDEEYNKAIIEYKKGNLKESHKPNIKFDSIEKNSSELFMDELLSEK